MDAIKPLDYYIDTTAALIRAAWYCLWHRGSRVEVVHRYVERRNRDYYGGVEYVEVIRRIRVVTGDYWRGNFRSVKVFYNA